MRIIAGSAKGLFLKTALSVTRPTMDRVRGAVFSMLGERVPTAHVLDLFAGTGGMGIEALSRGAATALFVDSNRKVTAILEKNLASTKLQGEVMKLDAFVALKLLTERERQFDLIFADPPYAHSSEQTNFAAMLLSSSQLLKLLAPEGLLILECEAKQQLPETKAFKVVADRTYGSSRIVIFCVC